MKASKLTPKQELYVQGLAAGKSQREAYKAAYGCRRWKVESIDSQASRTLASPKVRARYDELMAEVATAVMWDRARAARELIEVRDIALAHIRQTRELAANIDDHGKRELADLPKTAAQLVASTTAELNKMFRIYDQAADGDGRVTVIDDV